MIRKRSVLAVLLTAGLSLSCFNGYSTKPMARADEDSSTPTVGTDLPSDEGTIDPIFEPGDPSDDVVTPPESDTSAPDQDTTPSEPDSLGSEVAIDEKNFPDKYFREYVKDKLDTDKNGKLNSEERSNAKSISIYYSEIKSAKGIEYFDSLERLSISDCRRFTTLDISSNTNLTYLDCCFDDALTSLDISKNTKLTNVSLQCSKLASLDVSKNTLIDTLYCNYNNLNELDVTGLSKLTTLVCSGNKFTTLDVSKNLELLTLDCSHNKLTSLDVSKNSKLQSIDYGYNPIKPVDTSKNQNLTELRCGGLGLTAINLGKNPSLRYVYCEENKLFSLDLSKNTLISILDCSGNKLTSLDISKLTDMYGLYCSNNQLTSLDASKNIKLETLYCNGNKIASLDFTNNEKLLYLNCSENQLSSLDASKCPNLYYLETYSNNIKKLDVSSCNHLVSAMEKCELVSRGSHLAYIDPEKGDVILSFDRGTELVPKIDQPTPTPVPDDPYPIDPEPTPTVAPPPPPSNSGFEKFVERLYKIALNREPEAEGKAFWVKHVVEDGATGAECARFFLLDAPEFMNRKLSNEQFIDTLYSVFFDRKAEEGGKAYWLGQLKAGTPKSDVVNGFIESTEWCNVCASFGVKSGAVYHKATVPSDNAKAFATRLYTCCLGRTAEDAGLKYWSLALTNLEKNAAEAASLFFNSAEFINLQTTDRNYLERLYLTFMNREADQTGMEYWLSQLALGVSREAILKQFAESPEFTALCKQYGIERGTLPQPPAQNKKAITVMSMSYEVENMIKDYLKNHPDFAAKYDFIFTCQNNDGQLYENTLNNALKSGGPDIYVVEADYAFNYVKGAYASFAAPYSKIFSDFSERLKKADPAAYTISMGTNLDDQIVGLPYQSTAGVFIYRRSIAKAVFGSDSPDVVGKAIGAGTNSWDTFLKAADTLNKKGYSIVSSNGDIWNVVDKAAKTPWVIDGKLNIDPIRSNFMDLSKTIIDKGYSNDSSPWMESWYADMRGEGPRGVLGFFGPAWLVNYVISYTCTEAATGYGDWAVCESPYPFWWGGSWLLANKNVLGTEKQAAVAEILNYITLETSKDGAQYKWATGAFDFTECCDTVASNTVMKSVSVKWPFLGNQNPYPVFANAGAKASASSNSAYNAELNGTFMDLCNQYAHGQISKESALVQFRDYAESIGIEAS